MSSSDIKRKKYFQPVKVYIRPRPLNKNEIETRCPDIIQHISGDKLSIKSGLTERNYMYDRVFHENTSQVEVYKTVVFPLIDFIIAGYNCTVFAYGQSGTGKTYTMTGDNIGANVDFKKDPSIGLIPRAAGNLFMDLAKLDPKIEYTVRVSFIEIYNEEVRDLLTIDNHLPLRIYDDPENKGSVCLKGLKEATVCSPQEVYDWLNIGSMQRQTASTQLNRHSSRSHTVFTIAVHTRQLTVDGEVLIKTGKLHLVDLAGSESIGRSGATDLRAREAGTINKSLLTLGKVIKAVAQKMQHVPYRDSKLTRILQDSLGGKTKTCMVATISPAADAWDETCSTLDYALVARSVANCPEVNENRKQANVLNHFKEEIHKLQRELTIARAGVGFYVSHESYDKMCSDLEDKSKEIMEKKNKQIELLTRIQQIEEQKEMKEEEYEKLLKSFNTTKNYLNSIEQDLKEKDLQAKTHKYIMEYLETRETDLKNTANVLLDVCEMSTKREGIFYEKYKNQIDTTLQNANAARSIYKISDSFMEEVLSRTNNFCSSQATCLNIIGTNNSAVNEAKDEIIMQLTDASNKLSTHSNLRFDSLASHDSDSIENYIGSQFDTLKNMQTGKDLTCIVQKFKSDADKQNEDLTSAAVRVSEVIHQGIDKEKRFLETVMTIKEDLLSRVQIMKQEVQAEVSTSKELQDQLRKSLSLVERQLEQSHIKEKQLDDLHLSVIKEMSAVCENYQELPAVCIEQTFDDFELKRQNDVVSRSAAIESIDNIIIQNEGKWQQQVTVCKERGLQFIKKCISSIKDNLAIHNKTMCDINSKTEEVKLKLTTTQENITAVNSNLEVTVKSNQNYLADIKQFVKNTTSVIQNELVKNVQFKTHAGDTPARQTYTYPKTIAERIPSCVLMERFRNSQDDSASSTSDTEQGVHTSQESINDELETD